MPSNFSSFFKILGILRIGKCNYFRRSGKEVGLNMPYFAQAWPHLRTLWPIRGEGKKKELHPIGRSSSDLNM